MHWGADLQSEHERYLTEQTFKKPVIVTDYPKEIKAFYMRANDDGKTVRAMDVLAPRIGEIIGGSQREERYDVLLDKIRAQELERGGVLVVSGAAQVRQRAPRRLRPGLRAPDALPHRHEEHPRRDPVPAHARQRGVLRSVVNNGRNVGKLTGVKTMSVSQMQAQVRLTEIEAEQLRCFQKEVGARTRRRFRFLRRQLEQECLSPDEHEELMRITEDLENINVERMKFLAEIADRHQLSLAALIRLLNISPLVS